MASCNLRSLRQSAQSQALQGGFQALWLLDKAGVGAAQPSPPNKSQARKRRVGAPEPMCTTLTASLVPHKRALCYTVQGRGWAVTRGKPGPARPQGLRLPKSPHAGARNTAFFYFSEGGGHLALSLRAHKRLSKGRQKSIARLARNCPGGSWARAKGREAIPRGPQRGLFKGSRAGQPQERITRGCSAF